MNDDLFRITNWLRVKSHQQMIAQEADELNRARAAQLLYYVQGTCLAVYGVSAFTDKMIAGKHGVEFARLTTQYPVGRGIVGQLTERTLADYDALATCDPFTSILEGVWQNLGDLSAVQLMWRVRRDEPWRQAPRGAALDLDVVTTYFREHVVN
ncbi:Panacea domain-containing protein [Levilactobacillus enshiensis]|uniref:hypothetical protein n=1 Tax=Levilactobacillus enshiensis TaxID=2590213 RepID=UPI00117B23FD|nr:hypothetical protein [Levilactobacillus enshiensis]